MNILFLTQWWQPEPFFKGMPFAQELMKRGHKVMVLTGFPNYPEGKLYPGYKVRLFQKETMAGIRIIRTALYPSHGTSGIKRVFNYLSYALSLFILAPHFSAKPDVIYVYNLVTLCPTALLLKLLFRCPIVMDIQDIWPDSVELSNLVRGSFLLRILGSYCNAIYKMMDRITVLSPGFKALLIKRGIPEHKVDVIYNWCPYEEDAYALSPNSSESNSQFFEILYAGNLGKLQNLDTVLEAARIIERRHKNVLFTFIGEGIEKKRLEAKAVELRLGNIRFVSRVSPSEIGKYYQSADAMIVHLRNNKLFDRTIPSKVQAYLCAGKPILMGVRGDAADMIVRSQAGVCFTPEDPISLVDRIEYLLGLPKTELIKMSRNGRIYYQENLSMNQGVNKFERVFLSLKKFKLVT